MGSRSGDPAPGPAPAGLLALRPRDQRGSDLLSPDAWQLVRHAFKLSHRELEIVQLIFDGKKLAAIAQESRLALGTVKTYCQRLYRKVHVNDQRELALAVVAAYLELRPEAMSSPRMTASGRRPGA
jgi:DNA-binding NarL/FixJ family response regulator